MNNISVVAKVLICAAMISSLTACNSRSAQLPESTKEKANAARIGEPQGNAAKPKETDLEELHQIGISVSKAVLTKDIDTLLAYDRPDIRQSDSEFLKNSESDLYCMLFSTTCISWGSRRSVYDILRSKNLVIKARDLGQWGDGFRYADLLFYDESQIPPAKLGSDNFLCEQQGKKVVSWTFKRVDGKWESAFPMFDAGTEGLCTY